ncbi:unnamed protein product [Paramecium sonneborni]|uniref:Uncharacterized protein n=1 Tax=Paramecium sonneborni TaxID=65129 RepID=A0A8S1RPL7_9CILI|nr:unnamed protein product [Paramecium sonneborni]
MRWPSKSKPPLVKPQTAQAQLLEYYPQTPQYYRQQYNIKNKRTNKIMYNNNRVSRIFFKQNYGNRDISPKIIIILIYYKEQDNNQNIIWENKYYIRGNRLMEYKQDE